MNDSQTLRRTTRSESHLITSSERKAIVLAAVGQSYVERNIAQALRSTFPVNLGVTKEFLHVMDDCDEPSMPLEERTVSETDPGEIDALVTNFETLSNTTEESCLIEEEEAVRDFGHLEGVSEEPEHCQARPHLQSELWIQGAVA